VLQDRLSAFADRHGLPADQRAELLSLLRPTPLNARRVSTTDETFDWDTVDSEHSLALDGAGDAPEVEGWLRYEDLGPLGKGGMGEVRRVRDLALGRTLAMKLLRRELTGSGSASRFVAEAQVTAQLQHPGILPVHDVGRTPNGRPFYTMQEVRGQTLAAVIKAAHADALLEPHELRHLVGLFLKACEAVAFAHVKGVIHRDIKPQNIMVGDFGAVTVLDWGLARVEGSAEGEAVATVRTGDDAMATRAGYVSGTPGAPPTPTAATPWPC